METTTSKTQTRHTPGPWRAGWGNGTGLSGHRTAPTCFLDETGTHQIPIHVNGEAVAWVLSTYEDPNMAADAALIARAPEMAEALTVAASGLAEILVAVEITKARLLDATGTEAAVVESLGHIREAVEALRASTQAAAEGR